MNDYEIYCLASVDDWLVNEIARLMPQLSNAELPSKFLLNEILTNENEMVVVVRSEVPETLVGFGTLCVYVSPSGYHAHIEDVVVDEAERGRGIGEQIVNALIALADEKGFNGISLTCNPKRESANRLYARLGFKKWETNNYWFDL